jgi:hypothetical protein
MSFPFLPGGAVLALAVLAGALAVFGAALKALNWTIDAARGSMLNGVVAGMRNWDGGSRRSSPESPRGPAAPASDGPEVVDIAAEPAIDLQRVTPGNDAPRRD